MKRFSTFSAIALTFLTITPVAFAANSNETIVTNVGNERYVMGGTVTVNQPVSGDLTVAGGTVTVNAPVKGSLQAAGGTVTLANTVQGNVRIAGGTINVTKSINGNLVIAGGTVRVHPEAVIGGSVLIMGGDITIDGSIQGSVTVRGGTVTINGVLRGDTDIQSQTFVQNEKSLGNAAIASQTISFGPNGSIAKNLKYWSAAGKKDFSTVVKGTATFDTSLAINKAPEHGAAGFFAALVAAFTVYILLSAALILGLLLFATKTFFRDTAKILTKKPGMSFLHGILYFLLTPIITVILLITVIGFPIALTVAFMYIISIVFAKLLTAMVLARYAETYYKKKWTDVVVFFVALGIYIVLRLLVFIPILGWILTFIAVSMAYGAILQAKYDRYKKVR
jgi:hypothetical protein